MARKKPDIVIDQPRIMSVGLEVSGTAPLIQNAFPQKALEQMLRKHMGLSVQKAAKVPQDCIDEATIRNAEGAVCIPPTAFKKAMLTAAVQTKTLKKTHLRVQLYVEGQGIPVAYGSFEPRMDLVRTSGIGRTPDVRFRPQFNDWTARLIIQFADVLAVQTVVDLLQRAGGVGVGEWRPEKDGTYGTFAVTRHIDNHAELDEVRAACLPPLKSLRVPDWAMDTAWTPEMGAHIAEAAE